MAEYKQPYKWNSLQGSLGNVKEGAKYVAGEATDALNKASDATGKFLYDEGKFLTDVYLTKPLEAQKAVIDFATRSPEANTPQEARDVNAAVSATPASSAQGPTGPVKLDQNLLPDWAKQGIADNKAKAAQTQGAISQGGQQATQQSTQQPNQQATQGGSTSNNQTYVSNPDEYGDSSVKGDEHERKNYAEGVAETMQDDFTQTSEDVIYGKTTSDTGNGIVAGVDVNAPLKMAEQGRVTAVQNFLLQKPYTVAASLASGTSKYSEQTLTDVKRYAPEYWTQVESEMKKIQAGDTVNAIASGTALPNTGTDQIEAVNTGVNSWAMSNSDTPQQAQYEIQNISNAMGYNQTAGTAKQEILNINTQIEEYKKKINDLKKEANAIFKGDAPDYVVNAYMNNKRQSYQAEIEKLEGRRQSAFDVYKLEVSEYQNNRDYWLKYQQFQRDLNNDTWDRWYKEQQLNKANIHWENGKAYQVNSDGTITQLTDATALKSYQTDVQNTINGYKSLYTSGGGTKTATGYKYGVCGLECEGFTDMFTESTTGLTMLPRDENGNIIKGRSWTYAKEKMDYCNTWTPVVGSIAVGVGGVYDSTYGHTMLVTGWDPNTQMVELLWSNKDGDKTVYSTTDTLSNLYAKGLYGFWDPYKDMVAQNAGYSVGYDVNGNYITPMTEIFDKLISNATTAGEMEDIGRAEQGYDFLYEITHDNDMYGSGESSLDVFVDSGDLAKVLNYLSKENFEKSSSDEGNTFMSTLNDYKNRYMAKEFAGGVQSEKALSYLIQLVELKLRKESGAVINSGEWATNFNNLLPMPGESSERQYDKMKAWDSIILRQLRAGGFDKKSDYIPIFSESTVREIW